MAKVDVYKLDGTKAGDVTLSDGVFGLPHNAELVHQVYVAQSANRRVGHAHTKTRSERRGGGKKPWKQKGTGNARTGSIRNPIWRGGGVIFGPLKIANFTKKINHKMKQKALLTALSDKVRSEKVIIVDALKLNDNKTKEFVKVLNNLKIEQSVMILFSQEEASQYRALRNIPKTNGLPVEQINTYDVMNAAVIVMSKESLAFLEEKYKA